MLKFLFLPILGQAKEVADGRCPQFPVSTVKDSLDIDKIQGEWIAYYDEKELTNQFLCMGIKLKKLDANSVSFQQANSIYEVTRQHLREVGEPEADQKYFINSGRKVVFNDAKDKSVGAIEVMGVPNVSDGFS